MFHSKRSKYGAIRTKLNGRTFASRREAQVAQQLEAALHGKAIIALEYQPRFELIPKPNLITYVADFKVTFPDGHIEIWDVKGFLTDVFKLKEKMFHHRYPNLILRLIS